MGSLSDRVGRRPLLLACTVLMLVTAYPAMLWLVRGPSFSRLLIVELWLSFLYGSYNGAMVVFLTEIMPVSVRTSGFALAYKPGDRCLRWIYSGAQYLLDSPYRQSRRSRRVALNRRGVRFSGRARGQTCYRFDPASPQPRLALTSLERTQTLIRVKFFSLRLPREPSKAANFATESEEKM